MKDGLYRVKYKGICAGFVVEDNNVVKCAPILKRKINFWKKIAILIESVREEEMPVDKNINSKNP